MREDMERLIHRTAAVISADRAAGEQLIRDEWEPYLAELRAELVAGEAMLMMLRDMAAAKGSPVTTTSAGTSSADTDNFHLDDHFEAFDRTSSRGGAVLVLFEHDGLTRREIKERMEALAHRSTKNLDSALSRAAKASPPLVVKSRGRYHITDPGRDMARTLLA